MNMSPFKNNFQLFRALILVVYLLVLSPPEQQFTQLLKSTSWENENFTRITSFPWDEKLLLKRRRFLLKLSVENNLSWRGEGGRTQSTMGKTISICSFRSVPWFFPNSVPNIFPNYPLCTRSLSIFTASFCLRSWILCFDEIQQAPWLLS